MKRLITILVCLILAVSVCVPASAAVPSAFTFNEITSAPTIDGTIDSVYGSPIFDLSAKDLEMGNKNLFMADIMDGAVQENGTYGANADSMAYFKNVYDIMRTVGYVAYDKNNLYLAFDTTDIAPKASSNSAKPWHSTNFQLCVYVNQRLGFFTVAYAGTNKANIANDTRNEFDVDVMKVAFNEKSQNNFVYELVIPWSAIPGLKTAADVTDFRFGYVQTSMAMGYVCTAIGEGYHQDYDKLIPVTMKSVSGDSNTTGTTGNNNTVDDGTSAPVGGGTTINTDKDTTDANSENATTNEGEEIVVEGEKDYTMIIILAVVAGVVLIGGVVAVLLLNKKPAEEKKENKE